MRQITKKLIILLCCTAGSFHCQNKMDPKNRFLQTPTPKNQRDEDLKSLMRDMRAYIEALLQKKVVKPFFEKLLLSTKNNLETKILNTCDTKSEGDRYFGALKDGLKTKTFQSEPQTTVHGLGFLDLLSFEKDENTYAHTYAEQEYQVTKKLFQKSMDLQKKESEYLTELLLSIMDKPDRMGSLQKRLQEKNQALSEIEQNISDLKTHQSQTAQRLDDQIHPLIDLQNQEIDLLKQKSMQLSRIKFKIQELESTLVALNRLQETHRNSFSEASVDLILTESNLAQQINELEQSKRDPDKFLQKQKDIATTQESIKRKKYNLTHIQQDQERTSIEIQKTNASLSARHKEVSDLNLEIQASNQNLDRLEATLSRLFSEQKLSRAQYMSQMQKLEESSANLKREAQFLEEMLAWEEIKFDQIYFQKSRIDTWIQALNADRNSILSILAELMSAKTGPGSKRYFTHTRLQEFNHWLEQITSIKEKTEEVLTSDNFSEKYIEMNRQFFESLVQSTEALSKSLHDMKLAIDIDHDGDMEWLSLVKTHKIEKFEGPFFSCRDHSKSWRTLSNLNLSDTSRVEVAALDKFAQFADRCILLMGKSEALNR